MSYVVKRSMMRMQGGDRPFTIVMRERPWGMQPYLVDANGFTHGMLSISGNSKQRRQQQRRILRELNED